MAVKKSILVSLPHSFQIVEQIFPQQQRSHYVEKKDSEHDSTNGIQRYRICIDHWGKFTHFRL